MRAIHDHAQLFHVLHEFLAFRRQRFAFVLGAVRIGQAVRVVPTNGDEAHPVVVGPGEIDVRDRLVDALEERVPAARGVVDDLVNVGVDFTASLPFIILALTILAFLGTDVKVIIVIMAFSGWDRYAKLSRNLARSAYTEVYAGALEGLGLPTRRILLKHILPNIASALVVNMTLNFPGMILLETSLSFLGVGVQPPMSSLGTMLGFGRDYLTTAWWIAVVPGVAIVISTLSMSVLGDWVQQKLEPQSR